MVTRYFQRAQQVPPNLDYFTLIQKKHHSICFLRENRTNFHTAPHTRRSYPGNNTTTEGYSKVLHRFFCSVADLLLIQQFNVYGTRDHMQRSFSVTERIIRYLKLGRKKPHTTKGKKQFLKKIAGWLVKTLKLTPAPTIKLVNPFPTILILSDLSLLAGYKCCISLLPFFHNCFSLGQRQWRVIQLPFNMNAVAPGWSLTVHPHKPKTIFW